ncbi:MAG: hypothetical protein JNL42_02200 [Anaerolineae bacterium]|nr:hypothetical protein [Anaerolineae bacterium]
MKRERPNTLDELTSLALANLTPQERVDLAVRMMESLRPGYEASLLSESSGQQHPVNRSLLGFWQGVRVSDVDIDRARREMWGGFPREDV